MFYSLSQCCNFFLNCPIVAIMIRQTVVQVAMDRIKQMGAEEEAKDDRVL